jgi:hypothetical protein
MDGIDVHYTKFEFQRFWSSEILKLKNDLVANHGNFMLAPMHVGMRV